MIWAIELVNMFVGHQLNRFGILPRTLYGLIGIPLSPFLHGGIWHTLLNTVPFVVLGGLIITRGIGEFYFRFISRIVRFNCSQIFVFS